VARPFRFYFSLALFGLCSGTVAAASPAETVTGFHTALTQSMTDAVKLRCEGRMQRLQPVVDATFDLPFLSERALRRHWKNLSPEQRQQFTAALRQSVITTYATEFSEAGAVVFRTGTSETLANGDALVRTTLSPREGAPVSLDYILRPREKGWQVVNVLAEGVSDLALRASQYDSLMKADGFEALMARLATQTQQLKARCP